MPNSLIQIIFGKSDPGHIGSLVLDATISDSHSFRNTITDFPVESGGNISDHVIQAPEEVTIEGFVTNTPVKILGVFSIPGDITTTGSSGILGGEDKVQDAYTKLMQFAGYDFPLQTDPDQKERAVPNSPQLIDIVTGLRSYSDMAVMEIDIIRDKDTGQTLRFRGVFKKVVLTELQFDRGLTGVEISEFNPASAGAKKGGTKAADNGKAVPEELTQSEADFLLEKLIGP